MRIEKDIEQLIEAGVITEQIGDNIRDHYKGKKSNSTRRLFVVFGILGAVLVGLGIMLIVAHNWDDLSRQTKTFLAFLPLVIGQLVCGYTLVSRPKDTAWREGGSAFIFLALGSCIALVSQIYNILGDLNDFILTWMLLCFPLIYLMRSSMSSLFYIIGVSVHSISTGYGSSHTLESLLYWPMLLATVPYHYSLYKNNIKSNFLILHNWFVPLSLVLCLGTLADDFGHFMFLAYFSMFSLFFLLGRLEMFKDQTLRNNSYLVIGSLGITYILIHLSFNDAWDWMSGKSILFNELIVSPEIIVSVALLVVTTIVLSHHLRNKLVDFNDPFGFVFLIFAPIFLFGQWFPFSVIIINILVLILGVWIVRLGAKSDHLGQMNFGLIIIALLIVCRFFDTDLSFVLRGILFVMLGVGFFVANHRMLEKRKANEK